MFETPERMQPGIDYKLLDQELGVVLGSHQLNTLPSNAVDIAPYPLDWSDSLAFARLAGFVQAVADSMGIAVRWGGDWDQDGKSKDERFLDLVHFELV